jgi:hypothetical protein
MTRPDETTLTLTRRGDEYLLAGSTVPARLIADRGCSSGRLEVGHKQYDVVLSGLRNRAVSVVPSGGTEAVVTLSSKTPLLPVSGPSTWRIQPRLAGYDATLHADGVGEISLHVGHRSSAAVEVVVRGHWPERDLIVLAAAFALLRRRRVDVSAAAGGTAAVVTTSG